MDSFQVSAGLGLLTLMAARMAQRGVSAADIQVRVEEMRPRLHLLFVVDTLEYLARGGRIGKARALLGGLLGIKPILGLVGGEVAPGGQGARRQGGAPAASYELFKERVDAESRVRCWSPSLTRRRRCGPIGCASLLQENFSIVELLARPRSAPSSARTSDPAASAP